MLLRIGLILAWLSWIGCARIKPWQREDLARIERQLDRCSASRAYETHMWMVRESAIGGAGKPGGGCGCN